MYQPRTSIYICMMLAGGGQPIGAQVIQAVSLADAVDRAEELLACVTTTGTPQGYEL